MALVFELEENTFYSIDDILQPSSNYYVLEIEEGCTSEVASSTKKRMLSQDFKIVLKKFKCEIKDYIEDFSDCNLHYEFETMSFYCYYDGDHTGDSYCFVKIYGANKKKEIASFNKLISEFE